MVLYKQSEQEVVLKFKTTNTNNKNWFSLANILESPWQDIFTTPKNFFTIDGPCMPTGCRDFHIFHEYVYCPNDSGWLSVGTASECGWESRLPDGVKMIYSKITAKAKFSNYSKLLATFQRYYIINILIAVVV